MSLFQSFSLFTDNFYQPSKIPAISTKIIDQSQTFSFKHVNFRIFPSSSITKTDKNLGSIFSHQRDSQIDYQRTYINLITSKLMLLLPFYPNPQPSKWSQDPILFPKIHSFFLTKDIPTQILPSSPLQTKLLIQLHTKTPQIKKLQSTWTITPQEHLEIKISLHDPWNQSSPDINPTLMAEIVKNFNKDTHGVYFFQKNKMHVLEFRIKLPFTTSRLFLIAHLRELFLEISYKFAAFAAAVKILPSDAGQPSKKIVESVSNLRMFKEVIEFNRQHRKKSTNCYNLANNSLKIISEAFLIIGICFGKIKGFSRQNKIDLTKSNNLFKASVKRLDQRRTKQQNLNKKAIAKGIQIQHIHQQQPIDQGGFSKIYKGIYQIHQLLTCNYTPTPFNLTPPLLSKQTSIQPHQQQQPPTFQQIDKTKRILIKKMPKDEDDISYENQFNVLKHLRNQKSLRIAEYYLTVDKEDKEEEKDRNIFMEFYQSSFAKAHRGWRELDLLKAARQILEGIHFMWSNKIAHRDLKELNILIDSRRNAKIIDFGSSSGFHSNTDGQFISIHSRLMSTKSYFYSYNDLSIPFIKKQFTREEFNQAETFDIFSFGQILINIFSLDKVKDNMVFRELTFLAQKCQEINPQDRIYPVEALCYLEEIIKLYHNQNQIQMKGVEKQGLKVTQQRKSTNSTSQQ